MAQRGGGETEAAGAATLGSWVHTQAVQGVGTEQHRGDALETEADENFTLPDGTSENSQPWQLFLTQTSQIVLFTTSHFLILSISEKDSNSSTKWFFFHNH